MTRNNRRGPRPTHGEQVDNHSVSYENKQSSDPHYRRNPIRHLYRIRRSVQNNKTRHDLLLELWHAAQYLYTALGWRSGHCAQGTTLN